MKALFSACMVALFSVALLASGPVEAKRLGGGGSFGKSYSYSRTPTKQQAPTQNVTGQQANKSGAAAASSGRGMMGGMLGGLLAGSLLGALFFGGAFDGLQIMDLLMFGLLAFLGFKLFAMFRGNHARQQPAMAGAGPNSQAYTAAQTAPADSGRFEVPEIGSGLKGQPLSSDPTWFDEARFMSNVETHFRELQRIWDEGDFSNLKEYVTPEMYVHLREQHDALEGKQSTEIVSLRSELLDLLQDGDDVVAAIHFTGTLRENGVEEAISEVWHVRHPKDDASADWLLAGIRQMES